MINGWRLWVLFAVLALGVIPIVKALRRAEETPGWRATVRGVVVFIVVLAVVGGTAVVLAVTGDDW